jgi:hypothetical protein
MNTKTFTPKPPPGDGPDGSSSGGAVACGWRAADSARFGDRLMDDFRVLGKISN